MTKDAADYERRIEQGDGAAVAELFMANRERLKAIVRLRLDDRLRGRLDPSDVIQEVYFEVERRAADYIADRSAPAFVWLRALTLQHMQAQWRKHIGSKKRDIRREIELHRRQHQRGTTIMLADRLIGSVSTPSQVAVFAERKKILEDVLDQMDEADREVLTLRHFEELSNAETASVLGLKPAAASNRYIRALKRLKDALVDAGFDE